MHSHDHGIDASKAVSRKLTAASTATFVLVVAELIVGTMSGSLALVGDALHNFTDTLALFIALIAVRLERRPATDEKSFGYQRAGILAAFINAGSLIAFTAFIFVEAMARFRHPQPVNTLTMLITAAVALLLNAAITIALRDEGRHDVNIRGAVLHMFGDAVSSAGIIVAAILIRVTRSTAWDPAVSILIGALILWSSWGILRETVNLLLEGTPSGIDPSAVTQSLGAIDGIFGVHHLHIWALGPSRPALSCHLMVGDVPVSSTAALLDRVTDMLHHDYRIVHATVQLEYAECADDDPHCVPFSGAGTRRDT